MMPHTSQDLLESALVGYFGVRARARSALPELLPLISEDSNLHRRAFRLQGALDAPELLSRSNEVDLAKILHAAETRIEAGRTTRVYEGGYETHLSRDARAVSDAVGPIRQLHEAWQRVQDAIAVERALEKLRA